MEPVDPLTRESAQPAADVRARLLRLRQSSGTPATPRATTPQPPATLPLSLAERIERMRRRAVAPQPSCDAELARLTQGRWLAPNLLLVEHRVPLAGCHGRIGLQQARAAASEMLEAMQVETRDPEALVFFDTETSGLAGGTGTVVFLVGVARFEAQALVARQFLMTTFAAEAALIAAVHALVSAGRCLVSYNGKSFDAPLVRARALLQRAPDPFAGLEHVDLLHAVRRRYPPRWPDCRLRTAEARALGFARVDDLDGSLVPEAFRRFVRFGDAGPLPRILQHNRDDLVSLAALLAPLARDDRAARGD